MNADLIRKYDVPAPRYTSYPTVPYWSDIPTPQDWIASIHDSLVKEDSSWSLYIHIPFCETLCTFCGCNTTITKNHKNEMPYVDRLLAEFNRYLEQVPELRTRALKHLHLGGGTPTFLSEEQLEKLLTGILGQVQKNKDFEGSIEVDPRRTRPTQIELLQKMGFDRLSLGIQDFDPEVQKIIHRYQTFEQAEAVVKTARALGYRSLNFDLVYGLPKQTEATTHRMIERTLELRPDRIALYSFALVPWLKPGQKLFKDEDLPKGEDKRRLYEIARRELMQAGYVEIGMDHFALPTDSLAKSLSDGTLHRNFMGYGDQRTDVLLGLGVSAISESHSVFVQNEKVLPKYEGLIDKGSSPIFRGHRLTDEDQRVRQQIMTLMTLDEVELESIEQFQDLQVFLEPMVSDGLIELTEKKLKMKPEGRPFLRNACLGFDLRFRRAQPQTKTFSSSI